VNRVAAKFEAIHEDFEANITKVYRRRDILTALDLVVHSVLQFDFQGDRIRKGWVEGLIIGDTRTGKSESVQRMINHYRVGEMVTGENATFAGLVGGMQQTQKTWSITWGKLPLNDKRFLAVDELSGLPHEAISRMSGVRSSGVAEIIKIQTERTASRVRILWISNPRGKRPLGGFNSGIDAISDLIGQPEDIARFDFAMTAATNEVPLEIINSANRPKRPHLYVSDACNRLIHWAWSRKPEDVRFVNGAENACLQLATELSQKYLPPLVEGAEQRIKMARLAVAAACRVYSTDDGQKVLVKPEHVEFVRDYLDQIYSKPSMAFDLHSKAKMADREIHDVKAVQERFEQLPADTRPLLADAASFTVNDLQDYAACSRDAAIELASFLVRKRCIRKGKFGYYKLPAFTEFLRHFTHGAKHDEQPEPGWNG
jgi:hypothetical protein